MSRYDALLGKIHLGVSSHKRLGRLNPAPPKLPNVSECCRHSSPQKSTTCPTCKKKKAARLTPIPKAANSKLHLPQAELAPEPGSVLVFALDGLLQEVDLAPQGDPEPSLTWVTSIFPSLPRGENNMSSDYVSFFAQNYQATSTLWNLKRCAYMTPTHTYKHCMAPGLNW